MSQIISNPICLKLITCGLFLYILNIIHFYCILFAGLIAWKLRDKGYLEPYKFTKDNLGSNIMPLKYCKLLSKLYKAEEILYGIGLFILLDQRAKIYVILIYLGLYVFYLVYLNILIFRSMYYIFIYSLYHILLIFLLYRINAFVAIALLIKFILLAISSIIFWYFRKKNK